MTNTSPTIGKRIRRLRTSRGFTQSQLAKASQVSERHLIRYELDKVSPKADTVARIVGVFGVSLPAFFADNF